MTAAFEPVPEGISRQELRDELNWRAWRAGYCRRDGGPKALKIGVVCGFGRAKPLNVWPRDANGTLVEQQESLETGDRR
jgi:hypothetical protein